ncbi:dsRBD fold-containing protein [Sphaerisporangium dianthi]|uniref:DsRBD fold-containing protein n=1 Tax=Sphaerisporangium dianthi TaxID=1436120 RepID=A0ABV9CM76_9ACTN
MQVKQWTVEIYITEDDEDDRTVARAVLLNRAGTLHESAGYARRNPIDRPVPAIGDELAAGRALADLAAKLTEDAAEDVAQMAGQSRRV